MDDLHIGTERYVCKTHIAKRGTKKCLFEEVAQNLRKMYCCTQSADCKRILDRFSFVHGHLNEADYNKCLESGHAKEVREEEELLALMRDVAAETKRLSDLETATEKAFEEHKLAAGRKISAEAMIRREHQNLSSSHLLGNCADTPLLQQHTDAFNGGAVFVQDESLSAPTHHNNYSTPSHQAIEV